MRTIEALRARGVEADIEVVEGARHLFDTFPEIGVDFVLKYSGMMMCRMDELFSQSSPGANPIYSTKYVAGRTTGRRRLGTNTKFQHFEPGVRRGYAWLAKFV